MSKIKRWFTFRPWRRHSLVLMVGGCIYILIGISLLGIDELSARQATAWTIGLKLMGIEQFALLHVLAGLLACVSSTWPDFSDKWGYSVLTGLASGWSAVYILGFLMADAPVGNIYAGLVWGLMAFLWWAISGLTNPERRMVSRHGSS